MLPKSLKIMQSGRADDSCGRQQASGSRSRTQVESVTWRRKGLRVAESAGLLRRCAIAVEECAWKASSMLSLRQTGKPEKKIHLRWTYAEKMGSTRWMKAKGFKLVTARPLAGRIS